MKKRDLEKELICLGWWFKREGGNHEIWTNGEDTVFLGKGKSKNT